MAGCLGTGFLFPSILPNMEAPLLYSVTDFIQHVAGAHMNYSRNSLKVVL